MVGGQLEEGVPFGVRERGAWAGQLVQVEGIHKGQRVLTQPPCSPPSARQPPWPVTRSARTRRRDSPPACPAPGPPHPPVSQQRVFPPGPAQPASAHWGCAP